MVSGIYVGIINGELVKQKIATKLVIVEGLWVNFLGIPLLPLPYSSF
jgi:hypothetical protein